MSLNNYNQLEDKSYEGLFLAEVVDNSDPLKQQRVKAKIPGLLDGPDYPWLCPIVSSPLSSVSSALSVPKLGAILLVFFQNGDIHYGLYHGYVHTATVKQSAPLNVNYPNRSGFDNEYGVLYADSTSGSKTVHYQHPSGTTVDIDNAGNVTVSSVGSITASAATTAVVSSTSDMTLTSSSRISLTAPEVNVNGTAINFIGSVVSTGTVQNNGKDIGSTHTHQTLGVGIPTSAPL
jgi:Type VI secretion system/phage-baseplate injector OB domain